MLRICYICGKGPVAGRTLTRKGQIKQKGGTGSKVARANKRTFLPNLQRTRILVDNHPQRVYICTQCIKKGGFTKV
ncbi:MAG: 50S ribosomal protein L28 [Candidatus Omnitrophota bacterium]|nr:MAG: 50S ribosomal protein L28 [Candidatus Omnitrophota bacterium]